MQRAGRGGAEGRTSARLARTAHGNGAFRSARRRRKARLDLGAAKVNSCGYLLADPQFERILGMDVSWRSIEIANDRLKLNQLGEKQRARFELIQGSLMYRDRRLKALTLRPLSK